LKEHIKLPHVEALAPATSANLGAGFDVFGVALDVLHDKVSIDVVNGDKIELYVEGEEASQVPTDPDKNTAGVVAKALLSSFNRRCGLIIEIEKGIKPGSGLGSSAASAAATAVALNEALGLGLSRTELIRYAALGEVASAGVPHADNVSPAILGFFTIVVSSNPVEVIQLPPPDNVKFVVAIPGLTLKTSLARSVIPNHVKLSDAVHNIAYASSFVAGILLKDIALMGRSMRDLIADPYRAPLIPGLKDVKENAIEAGALGLAISGAGPSVLALIDSEKNVEEEVAKAMKKGFEKNGVESKVLVAKPCPGTKIVRRKKP